MVDTVFAFDRDLTVDVNQGPVPLEWVRHLDGRPDSKVIAIGNQRLVDEADVVGLEWLADQLDYEDANPAREERVRRVREWAEERDIHILYHVDDVKVEVDRVEHYFPEDFVDEFDGLYGLPP